MSNEHEEPWHPNDPSRHEVEFTELPLPPHRQHGRKIMVLLILSAMIVLVLIDANTTQYLERFDTSLINWLSSHFWSGIFVIILIYIVATILFIPGSILTVGTGYAFHQALQQEQQQQHQQSSSDNTILLAVVCSSVAVFVGATFGSIICFLMGRYLFRDNVQQLANRYDIFRAMDRALEGNGFKIMILLRLSPLIPYNALDYISGITSISIGQYSLALIGIIPGTITFCYLGATASTFTDGTASTSSNSTLHKTLLVVGVLFAIAGAAVASYYSKIELDKIIQTDTIMNRTDFAQLDTMDPTTIVVDDLQSDALNHRHHGTFATNSVPLRPIGGTPLT